MDQSYPQPIPITPPPPPAIHQKSRNRILIIVAIVIVLSCCCILIAAGIYFMYTQGLIQLPGSLATIPQACGLSDETVDWGPLQVSSQIILGRHRPWQGDANWEISMNQYVSKKATITELLGVDPSGCPITHVDIDNGEWVWRIRDMKLVR